MLARYVVYCMVPMKHTTYTGISALHAEIQSTSEQRKYGCLLVERIHCVAYYNVAACIYILIKVFCREKLQLNLPNVTYATGHVSQRKYICKRPVAAVSYIGAFTSKGFQSGTLMRWRKSSPDQLQDQDAEAEIAQSLAWL